MKYHRLESCGFSVSDVSLGTHTFSGECWGTVNDAVSRATIEAAVDAGVNLFDTAHAYGLGHAEDVLGDALKGVRDDVVICTKIGSRWDANGKRWTDCSYPSIIESLKHCLRRLRTDYVDLYLLHYPDPNVGIQESMRAMADLMEQGLIRGTGVSRFSLRQLKAATQYIDISVAQYPLSIFDRQFGLQPGYDELHATWPVLEFCRQKGIGVMAYGSLAKGLLAGKKDPFPHDDWRCHATRFQPGHYEKWQAVASELDVIAKRHGLLLSQLAIRWTLSQAGVITSVVGARNPAHIMQNIGASGETLPENDLAEIEEIMGRAGHCPDFYSE
jgi:aryl-alcohol dehydrogenase-like predicted oxidoreductase